MARRPKHVGAETRIVFHRDVLDKLDDSVRDGVYDAAKAGMERQIEYARPQFKTIRRFQSRAFVVGFDKHGRQFRNEGRNIRRAAVDRGPVAYFGYNWFVARFFETGTVKHRPRPSTAPARTDIEGKLPNYLRTAALRKGFR